MISTTSCKVNHLPLKSIISERTKYKLNSRMQKFTLLDLMALMFIFVNPFTCILGNCLFVCLFVCVFFYICFFLFQDQELHSIIKGSSGKIYSRINFKPAVSNHLTKKKKINKKLI